MAIENPAPLLSYEDYAALPFEGAAEVVDGVLHMTPAGARGPR